MTSGPAEEPLPDSLVNACQAQGLDRVATLYPEDVLVAARSAATFRADLRYDLPSDVLPWFLYPALALEG